MAVRVHLWCILIPVVAFFLLLKVVEILTGPDLVLVKLIREVFREFIYRAVLADMCVLFRNLGSVLAWYLPGLYS